MPQRGALDAGYAFRHALYREVLYQRIAPLARAELHRKVAASLERERAEGRNVSAAELAFHFELGREPMAALRYYAEAAESALLHFSPLETMSLTERALSLLPPIEAGNARTALEITLAALQGAAAIQSFGIASIEAKRAFERARSLLDDVPQHPLRGLFLHALGLVLFMRGELDEASTSRNAARPCRRDGRPHDAALRVPRARIGSTRARSAANRARVAGESARRGRGARQTARARAVRRRPDRHCPRPARPRVAAARVRRPGTGTHARGACARACVA